MTETTQPPKSKGGRPKSALENVKNLIIGVRLTVLEKNILDEKSKFMGMRPAQFLRETALSRKLPSPPVPEINREQYVELSRLSNNLNQLTRLAHTGHAVIDSVLLQDVLNEVGKLRLALLGIGKP